MVPLHFYFSFYLTLSLLSHLFLFYFVCERNLLDNEELEKIKTSLENNTELHGNSFGVYIKYKSYIVIC